jgi:Dissimilatory sulfite reductase (desulfoviridin), alpha and beta subunits
MEFFGNVKRFEKPRPAFLFNSRAMYSCNTNRILAKKIHSKNLVVIKDKDYRSPASDGALLAPFIRRFFEFDKSIKKILENDCCEFIAQVLNDSWNQYIPRFRLSSILNAPNKLFGHLTTFNIYLHEERCIQCKKCAHNCPHNAINLDMFGFPQVVAKRCENCYRCIHNCPKMALSLCRKYPTRKIITYSEI